MFLSEVFQVQQAYEPIQTETSRSIPIFLGASGCGRGLERAPDAGARFASVFNADFAGGPCFRFRFDRAPLLRAFRSRTAAFERQDVTRR
jgi:hypothetical protein